MQFLYFLQNLRTPFFNELFSIITLLGEEIAFMAVSIIVFWCFSKTKGYFLLITGFLGTVVNQFLKMICKVPRPWVKDKNFTAVESAIEGAGGYSFPSGHTQSSVTLYGGIARAYKQKTVRIIMIALCVLVPFSRMYLGVHTPEDVLVSVAVSLILIFFGYPLFERATKDNKIMWIIILSLFALTVAFMLYVNLYPFDSSVYLEENYHNLESAQKNSATLLGCALGLIVVYPLEKRFVNFDTKAVWWAQIIKVIVGLAIVLLIKEGLKTPLDLLFNNEIIARVIRYFIMVITAGLIYPISFKYFAKLGKKHK